MNEENLIVELNGLLTVMARGVVTKPSYVKVKHQSVGKLVAFTIMTDRYDVPRVLGKKGRHFKAMQAVMVSVAKLFDLDVHMILDDKNAVENPPAAKQKYDMPTLLQILRRIVDPFLERPESVQISTLALGETTIINLSVADDDYDSVYGKEVTFDYAEEGGAMVVKDGNIIGSIKNIFDGIAKNHGFIVKITLNKL